MIDVPTPCFLLEEELLQQNIAKLKSVVEQTNVTLLLAIKAFSMPSAFPMIRDELAGVAASSLHEAKLGREEFGKQVHTYSPAFKDDEWNEIAALSTGITFNSLQQFETFKDRIPTDRKVGLRINPEHSEAKTELYDPCAPCSRLGMTLSEMPKELPEKISGLHFHTLSENDSFALERTLQAVEEKFEPYLKRIDWLNLGGGHLITHRDYNREHLVVLLKRFQEKYPQLEIVLEPGAAIAWQTGILITTVLDVIEREENSVAIIDSSFSAHMPDTLEMPYRPHVRGTSDTGRTYKLGGLTCLAGDYLGDYTFPEALTRGDQVIFEDMMHYTMVKTNTFNGVNLPAIAIRRADGQIDVIRTFGYEDFKRRL